ncbi:MAG: hypothetical protein VKL20_07605 [Synechocystis sp.]|nr:hypothetical protein [Synechocystis sp.]
MRNVLTLVALLLSTTGIFVSLAREELRCRLGLSSTECVATEQPANPSQDATMIGDRPSESQPPTPNAAQPDPKSPIPSTAKLMETMDQLRDSVIPNSDPETPREDPNTAPIAPAAPAQTDSTTQDPQPGPDVPLTTKENGVDTANLGTPDPPNSPADAAPIAPPAQKNADTGNTIPVIPAQGVAIPVTPPDQE